MKHAGISLLALLAGTSSAAAQTNVNWGLQTGGEPRTLGVYDTSHTFVPVGTVNDTSHAFSALSTTMINIVDPPYNAVCNGASAAADTAALTAALAAIQASTFGGTLFTPDGDCNFSAAQSVALGANQRLVIRPNGQHASRWHWSNSASAGITVTLAPVTSATWISNGPSFSAENLTFVSDWSTTTSQAALSVTATLGTGSTYARALPPAVSLRNINSLSKTNSGGFANLVSLTNIATSKLENLWLWAASGDTTANALSISAPTSAGESTGLRINGIRQQGGGTALNVSGWIQGVYVTDMQTVGTQHSVQWLDPGNLYGGDNLIVDHSQLNSALSEIDVSNVIHVQVANNYFLAGGTGWYGAKITGGLGHAVTGNAFLTGGDATASGVIFNNTDDSTIIGNNFSHIESGSATSAPILLTGTTKRTTVQGNVSDWTYVLWDASSNPSSNKPFGNVGSIGGVNAWDFTAEVAGALGAGSGIVYWGPSGADANVQSVFIAKGLPAVDWRFMDGLERSILDLHDSQNGGSGSGLAILAAPNGVSPQIEPQLSTNNMLLGASGPLATTATGGMIQIPYMAGAPMRAPATTGGATMVYDTTNDHLWIWNPVSSTWKQH